MATPQKITPNLWFDRQAEEAAALYTSAFKNSSIGNVSRYGEEGYEIHGMPAGTVMTVEFQIEGQWFTGLNGGPMFQFTPAVSFFVSCDTEAEIDELYSKLSAGGFALMPLQEYPFSKKFVWLQDRYGVSWQLNLASAKQKIAPFLLFVGDQHGKAEEAMNFYVSLFKNSSIINVTRHEAGGGEQEGTIMNARFSLDGQEFMAMDSGLEHQFTFTEATSFIVHCETGEEVDYFWERLSQDGDPAAQQCGWLKDRYGVSWQVIPNALLEMLSDPDPEKSQRVTKVMLQMKKLDVEALKQAYEGRS